MSRTVSVENPGLSLCLSFHLTRKRRRSTSEGLRSLPWYPWVRLRMPLRRPRHSPVDHQSSPGEVIDFVIAGRNVADNLIERRSFRSG